MVDFLVGETFQKSQHGTNSRLPLRPILDSSRRRSVANSLPSLQRSFQGRRLLLQQGQVVDGIEDEVVPFVGAGMSGNDLSAAADHHLST